MVLVFFSGLMVKNTKAIIKMGSDMVKENTYLRAKGGMRESGSLVYNQEVENIAKVLTQLKASGKKVSF
jgi:hypothetical protein